MSCMGFREPREQQTIKLKTSTILDGGATLAGKYSIIEVLGSGGMSTVYRAEDEILQRSVAIKVLHPFLSNNEVMIKRFLQEGRAISQLNHPHIVRVHEFGIVDDAQQPYIVMDCVQGESLQQYIRSRGRLSTDEAVLILRQLATALGHAHARGVLHRDLKPSNVMIAAGDDGKPAATIVDFGIAKVTRDNDDASRLTATGEVFGSPMYMSPEQARGMNLDARSDLYSLGCLMYEAVVGKPPVDGANPLELLYNKMNNDAAPVGQEAPNVPPFLCGVIDRLLQREPDKRFQSAEALLAALDSPGEYKLSKRVNYSGRLRNTVIAFVVALVCILPLLAWSISTQHQQHAQPAAVTLKDWFLRSQHITDRQLASLPLPSDVRTLDLADSDITDQSSAVIARLTKLESLGLDNSKITDEFLSSIPRSIGWLSLNGTHLTSKGVASLSRFPHLHGVTLDGIPIDTAAAQSLADMNQLRELYLRGPSIDDSVLHNISSMTQLAELSATGGGITDNGIDYLNSLTNLRKLDLSGNSISAAGLKKLQKAHPGCEIIVK